MLISNGDEHPLADHILYAEEINSIYWIAKKWINTVFYRQIMLRLHPDTTEVEIKVYGF